MLPYLLVEASRNRPRVALTFEVKRAARCQPSTPCADSNSDVTLKGYSLFSTLTIPVAVEPRTFPTMVEAECISRSERG